MIQSLSFSQGAKSTVQNWSYSPVMIKHIIQETIRHAIVVHCDIGQ